jgi:hypothetical protein
VNSPITRPPLKNLYDCNSPDCGLEVISYVSYCSEDSNRFAERIDRDGNFNLTILGAHTTWKGFGRRLMTYRRYLLSLPPSKIIMLVDGTDVAFLPTCTAQVIIDGFKKQKSPMYFLGEIACWPDKDKWTRFPVPKRKPDNFR